ncbi:hypothetical protein BDV29DRAFT_174053 [Aspergillus leporis]|uniref:Extracellular membrane protein CFEM domain-containing protein n=1 Tax=Aspergillus leporis TaxID=41062 RepID=A0A5N5X2D5_9EURO|nr:hypothetical protein BDV29DRAFT_174053 [Aspergillus leporis]
MKFNLLALTTLLAVAAAQSSDTAAATTTTTTAATTTASLSPEQSCALKCDKTDGCCIAACFKVPCPNASQANDTNNCVAACPQGTGTPSDTQRYIDCSNRCLSSHFFPITATGGSGASQTSASDSDATTTGKGSSSSGSSGSGSSGSRSTQSGSGTGTNSGSSPSETNAASIAQMKLGVSVAGVVGAALGIWAL